MATIAPFRGILYNPRRVQKIASVVAPPYDIISEEAQKGFYRLSKYNIVRIELGKCFRSDTDHENCYTRARRFLREWLSEGILQQDAGPAVYAYLQRFPKGRRQAERFGFVALLKLEKEGYRSVYPHEHTLTRPKEDRLKLMGALRANVSPIFFLFPDKRRQVERLLRGATRRGRPLWDIALGREHHTFWRLNDPKILETLQGALKTKRLFIADGHHRFEVALSLRDQMGYNFVMAYFSNLLDDSLVILPIHRLVRRLPFGQKELWKRLNRFFTVEEVGGIRSLLPRLSHSTRPYLYGMVVSDKPYLLKLRRGVSVSQLTSRCPHSSTWKRLEVTVLHEVILKHILGFSEEKIRQEVVYERDLPACIKALNQGKYEVGFFLRPPRIQEVRRIALLREKMPQKSTYFYPKPLTGLVMHHFALPAREED